MNDTISARPLAWPVGWKRTPNGSRVRARFGKKTMATSSYTPPGGSPERYAVKSSISIAEGVARVRAELSRMGIRDDNIVINSNLELRLDGMPRSGQREPDDPGVAVYWRDRGETRCMAIDQYDRVADNLGAIAATLDAMRAIERHGGADVMDRAFTGFVALPAPTASHKPWWEVLGVASNADEAKSLDYKTVRGEYLRRRSAHHPDNKGDPNLFNMVTRAWEQFEAEVFP